MTRLFLILTLFPFILKAEFDHSYQDFNQFLKKYVAFSHKQSTVDYKDLKVDSFDRLKTFNAKFSTVSNREFENFSSKQKLAFLINAYNSFTLQLVTENYPVNSIKDIKTDTQSPWDYAFVRLLEKKVSLNQIEHELIRKQFKEPRIHFVLVCAAKSCPPLQNFAYTAENLEQQLESSTKNFLSDPTRNYFDINTNTLNLSKLFEWYQDDFKDKDGKLDSFLKKHFPKFNPKSNIQYIEYDWSLNN